MKFPPETKIQVLKWPELEDPVSIHKKINRRNAQALLEQLMAECEAIGYEKAELKAKEVCDSYAEENQRLHDEVSLYRWLRDNAEAVELRADPDNFVRVWAKGKCFYGKTLDEAIKEAMK